MITTNTDAIKKLSESMEKNHQELMALFTCLDDNFNEHTRIGEDFRNGVYGELNKLKEDRQKNPTLFEWVKQYPKRFVSIISGVFLLANVWFISGIRYTVTLSILHFFRLPDDVIDQILQVLFTN